MPVVSPRLDSRLRRAAVRLDDPREPMAETWRRVGAVAEELGLTRPGYDSIRLIVRDHRRAREEIRAHLEPVLSDLLQGRMSAWDVQRLIDAATVQRTTRSS
jgi:hypothetical protein